MFWLIKENRKTNGGLFRKEVDRVLKFAREQGWRVVHRRNVRQIEIYEDKALIFRATNNGDAFWVTEYNGAKFSLDTII